MSQIALELESDSKDSVRYADGMEMTPLEQCFDDLASEARELYLDTAVPVLSHTPSPVEFYRQYVSSNKPVVLSDFSTQWPALRKWSHDYLSNFELNFWYNSGKTPDAVNLWIGDGRAVTSMHRDHYENLYCVISGSKTFTLIPPTDLPFVPYENYPAARYRQIGDEFIIEEDKETGIVPWIPIDPLKPDLKNYPEYSRCQTVEVTVHAGQVLYLPSMWFHHVQQSHGCIAVNLWYDMEFDIKYTYYKFLEKLVQLARRS
ncbi:hypothetical protein C0Q70_05069 [Pomacea canaliculata]|uniref:JmjC domain-containing protein n=1 Tax=Pomacea canaliculata TaxID=400727 RepID=A0A2T7PK75_POMCA|nr:hypothetical protein C0Q70_05069 [Pomacea canaliculata]